MYICFSGYERIAHLTVFHQRLESSTGSPRTSIAVTFAPHQDLPIAELYLPSAKSKSIYIHTPYSHHPSLYQMEPPINLEEVLVVTLHTPFG